LNVKPILLIDLDPDGSLAKMLGVDLEKENKLTISDALYGVIGKGKEGKGKTDAPGLLKRMIEGDEIIHRDEKFNLITLGTKLAPGCYCAPDEMVKAALPELIKNYEMVLIDSPAGLEHLNRKVTPDIDDLFVILDPSEKSGKHIERIKYVARGVKIQYKNFFLVGNYRFNEEAETILLGSSEQYLGRIQADPLVRECNLKGESLLTIPENSPASLSVKEILLKAGYRIIS
jgi:CO dehydrogenase maturation factor